MTVTAVFYLGENHPLLVARSITLTKILATVFDPNPVTVSETTSAVFTTFSGLAEGTYQVEIAVDLECDPSPLISSTFSFQVALTPGFKQYCGEHNCPRCLFVCEDEDIQSSDSSSSHSLSESSISESSQSPLSDISSDSSLSSGSSGL